MEFYQGRGTHIILAALIGLTWTTTPTQGQSRTGFISAPDSMLLSEVSSLQTLTTRLLKQSDSLSRELLQHRANETFFSSALDEQANRFAVIVAALLAIIGFISYRGFKWEVDRIKEAADAELQRQKDAYIQFENRIKKAERTLFITSGNTLRIISDIEYNRSRKVLGFAFALQSAAAHHRAYELGRKDIPPRIAIRSLEIAATRLKKIVPSEQAIKLFDKHRQAVVDALNQLNSGTNDEIVYLCAEIRLGLQPLMPINKAGAENKIKNDKSFDS